MADYSTPSAPIVDAADATPGARPWGPNGEPVNEPAEGDDQRRCWNLLAGGDGTGTQCLLFNGHPGPHQHDVIGSDLAEAVRRRLPTRLLPWFALQKLREEGLLEGEAFDRVWEPMVRDADFGKLLLERYGVVFGRDGDRLYIRKATS